MKSLILVLSLIALPFTVWGVATIPGTQVIQGFADASGDLVLTPQTTPGGGGGTGTGGGSGNGEYTLPIPAGALWIATTGSDANACTEALPCLTIGHGLNQLTSGDTLVIKDGLYTGTENFINSGLHSIPTGTANAYTVVRAENPYGVRLQNTGSLLYYDNLIRVQSDYVRVDGIIAELNNSNYPPAVASISGNYNKITRSIFKRTGGADQYSTWLTLSGDYNLAEDVAGVGNARYGFYTGSSNSPVHHNIFRRAIGRVDYTESTQPKSAFAMYGNNSGTGAEFHLFQNVIAIDGHAGPTSPQPTYGGIYFPKNAKDVRVQGSLFLNNDAAYSGLFVKELQGQNITIEHTVSWSNNTSTGLRFGGSYGPLDVDYVTIGDHPYAFYNNSASVNNLTNSLIYYDTAETSNNNIWSIKTNNDIQNYTAVDPLLPLDYITVPPDNTQGADLTKTWGESGTLWGEPGYDTVTTNDLWPWPYEDEIKTVFAETNVAPAGVTPSSNTSARGFAAAGNDAFGQPLTLTRYVWQYLGNEIPSTVYSPGGVVPTGALWVATTGSDTNPCTEALPCLTISYGTSQLVSGGTLVVKDGVYDGKENYINDYINTLPSGTAGNYTTVRAENIMGVTLTNSGSLTYPDNMVRMDGSYIDVYGFILDMRDTRYPPFQANISGDHNKFRKSIVRREGIVDNFGSWVNMGGQYNLVEDVAGVGATRYGFGGGGTTSTSAFNIYRRVVGRFDTTASNQPKATFNHYGNNGGYGTHHYIYQNCISLDGNEVDRHGGSSGFKYGGFTSIKTAADDMYVGNIALNELNEYGGMWLDGRDHILRDNVIWDIQPMPTYGGVSPDGIWDRSSMEPLLEASNFTIGQIATDDINGASGNLNLTNSNLSPVGQEYLLQPNSGNTTGATILKKVGVTGTLYGEPGWDTVTNDDLWPWQYEDEIKTVFAIPHTPAAGYTPLTNDTTRGFAAPGNDAYGQPLTLTRYIWQYLGNEIPSTIYGGP